MADRERCKRKMLFVVQFRDVPEKLHLRAELMRDHLVFLKERDPVIRAAGSLRREEDACLRMILFGRQDCAHL